MTVSMGTRKATELALLLQAMKSPFSKRSKEIKCDFLTYHYCMLIHLYMYDFYIYIYI